MAPLNDHTEAAFLNHARERLDWDEFENIRRGLGAQTANKAKYFETERWLRHMWQLAKKLDLHQIPTQRILDLGTGPGHFPYACAVLGHDACGLDRPGSAAYAALTKWMDVKVVQHKILAQVPLPTFPARFDLVTGFRVGFNSKGRHGNFVLFDIDDWAFFLDDLRDNVVKTDGRIVLKMIAQSDYAGPQFGDAALMEYFESRGAVITAKGRFVWFDELR